MTSTIKVDNIQNQCGANIINESSNTITIGASGDTVSLASGASQTGFGRTGTVDWDTTAKTASFSAVSGNGYFVDTTSGAITATLPASPSAGDIVGFNDYARTFATNNLTVARNGSNIQGSAVDATFETNGQSTMFVYVDATQGWIPTEDQTTEKYGAKFIVATGGTITCCGDYKIHTFTGPGTFTVSCAGNPGGSNSVDYLVVAGGAGGGCMSLCSATVGGGGGAGGHRFSASTYTAPPTSAPLAGSALPVSAQGYPIVVGAGSGAARPPVNGSNSSFSTITSAGGGNAGGAGSNPRAGGSGGGGSAGGAGQPGGSGNSPPVSPSQGNDGGDGVAPKQAGGGGGALAAGNTPSAGNGGNGRTLNITGSDVIKAGGGGGANNTNPGGGDGGGGTGSPNATGSGSAAPANSGSGGGGSGHCGGTGGNGGSGIVIIRYKYQ